MMNLGYDVSGKRFNAHNNSKLRGFVHGKRFNAHGTKVSFPHSDLLMN